jgi:STE24 endopeptidase
VTIAGRHWSAPAVAATVIAVVGVVFGVWRPWAPALPPATTDLATFTPAVMDTVAAYRAPRVVAAILARAFAVAVPVLVVVTPLGRRFVGAVAGDGDRRPLLRAALLAGSVSLLVWAAVTPIAVWAGLIHDGAWGLRTASAALWWRDRLVAGLLNAVLAAVLGAAVLALLRKRPVTWPWHATWMATAAIGLLSFLWPLVVAPLFLPARPLEDGPVRDAVTAVLDEAGMADAKIEVAAASTRTTRVNAMVTGLGPSRRVVLHDTLLERPLPEVEAVLAHELGHRLHRDIARGVGASVPAILLGAFVLRRLVDRRRVQRAVGAGGPADPAMIAVVFAAIAVMQAVSEPAVLWYSRQVEAAADHRALVLGDDPAALIGIKRAFVVQDLAMPDPPGWQVALLSTHPPVGARIRYAAAYAALHGIPLPDLAAYEAAEPPGPSRPGAKDGAAAE